MQEQPSRPETSAAWSELAQLVQRAASLDGAAEAMLCGRFVPAVRTFARRRVRSAEAVEEFTQDVMLAVIQALRTGSVSEPERFAGFVLGVCRNVARERARVRDRRAALWEAYGSSLEPSPGVDVTRDADEIALLEDCLSQLSARSREVVRHAYVGGESSQEIALRLELQEGHVRVIRHRALGALRDCLHAQPRGAA
jgi:RNA polymerase sigma-70 factor (ECF subfamily)